MNKRTQGNSAWEFAAAKARDAGCANCSYCMTIESCQSTVNDRRELIALVDNLLAALREIEMGSEEAVLSEPDRLQRMARAALSAFPKE